MRCKTTTSEAGKASVVSAEREKKRTVAPRNYRSSRAAGRASPSRSRSIPTLASAPSKRCARVSPSSWRSILSPGTGNRQRGGRASDSRAFKRPGPSWRQLRRIPANLSKHLRPRAGAFSGAVNVKDESDGASPIRPAAPSDEIGDLPHDARIDRAVPVCCRSERCGRGAQQTAKGRGAAHSGRHHIAHRDF